MFLFNFIQNHKSEQRDNDSPIIFLVQLFFLPLGLTLFEIFHLKNAIIALKISYSVNQMHNSAAACRRSIITSLLSWWIQLALALHQRLGDCMFLIKMELRRIKSQTGDTVYFPVLYYSVQSELLFLILYGEQYLWKSQMGGPEHTRENILICVPQNFLISCVFADGEADNKDFN